MRDISDNLMWIFENWVNDQYSQPLGVAVIEFWYNVTWICNDLDYYMIFAKLSSQP